MGNSDPKTRLKEIIDSYLNKDGGGMIDTGIVASHLAQMKLFGIRQGVEFFPAQDNFGNQRKDFVDRVIKYNQLDTRLDSIWDYFLCDGQGIFYIRPTKTNYRLYYFRKHEYRSYYNIDGQLDEVVIIYSYKVRQGSGYQQEVINQSISGPDMLGAGGSRRYIRLSIKKKVIQETHSEGEISFDSTYQGLAGKTKTFTNSLGFIPCVEIFNNAKGFAAEGVGEFDALANHICTHDEMIRTMRKNVQFFGNPTLLSSRPKTDLMESGESTVQRPSIAANSGFAGMNPLSQSRFKTDPLSRGVDGQIRVPRVIANLEPNDRVGYIVPDAITGDQNSFSRQYREEIRTALGGVDELSISAGVTATEYKSLFGRVAATAKKKSAFRSTRQTSNIISKNSIFILLVISSCLVITSFYFFKTDVASTNPEDVYNNVTIDFPSSLLEDSVLIESNDDGELSCEYFVQIGAYGNKKYALEAEKMLMGEIQNITIDIVYSTQLPGKPLNSVISGPYENRSAANNAREKITKNGFDPRLRTLCKQT